MAGDNTTNVRYYLNNSCETNKNVWYYKETLEGQDYLRLCSAKCAVSAPFYTVDTVNFAYSCTKFCASNVYFINTVPNNDFV